MSKLFDVSKNYKKTEFLRAEKNFHTTINIKKIDPCPLQVNVNIFSKLCRKKILYYNFYMFYSEIDKLWTYK